MCVYERKYQATGAKRRAQVVMSWSSDGQNLFFLTLSNRLGKKEKERKVRGNGIQYKTLLQFQLTF